MQNSERLDAKSETITSSLSALEILKISTVETSSTNANASGYSSSSSEENESDCNAISNSNAIAVPQPMSGDSNIGSAVVQNSNDVHFGNRIICNGPVIINQTSFAQNQFDQPKNRESEIRMANVLNRPGKNLSIQCIYNANFQEYPNIRIQ